MYFSFLTNESTSKTYSKTDPTFLIIGAQKAATTWLYKMMAQHPDVFIPEKKEINFFNKTYNYQKGISWYRSQFFGAEGEKAIGDVTPNYLWTSSDPHDLVQSSRNGEVPKLVYKHYPDIKLIVSLRNPVDRAISAFLHHIRARNISPQANIFDVGEEYGIFSMGYYARDLQKWFEYFSLDQFLFLIYEEDILENKRRTLKKVFQFVVVDKHFEPNNLGEKYNKTEGDLYLYLHYYFPVLAKSVKKLTPKIIQLDYPKIEVNKEQRAKLAKLYAPHNRRLENLLGQSLPWQ